MYTVYDNTHLGTTIVWCTAKYSNLKIRINGTALPGQSWLNLPNRRIFSQGAQGIHCKWKYTVRKGHGCL